MWITVFAITCAAALGFAAAAVWRSQKEFSSLLADLADTLCDDPGGHSFAVSARDDRLVLDRIKLLRINLDEMVRTEPLLLRQLLIRCWGCASKAQCRRDLGAASASDDWRDYCPNAPMLRALGILPDIGPTPPAAAARVPS